MKKTISSSLLFTALLLTVMATTAAQAQFKPAAQPRYSIVFIISAGLCACTLNCKACSFPRFQLLLKMP